MMAVYNKSRKNQTRRNGSDNVAHDGSFMGFSFSGEDSEIQTIPDSPAQKDKPQLIGPDAPEYLMNHARRGKVIIFNHEEYGENLMLPQRMGTEVDKINIKLRFEKMKFDVEICDNNKAKEILSKLKEESKDDYHATSDCLVIAVLTHGEEEGKLYACDETYHVDDLWVNFTATKCPYLAGKPKIFIIQACRGQIPSQAVNLQNIQTDSVPLEEQEYRSYTIPAEADILLAYSTYEGRVAHRNVNDGTWFIEELCAELERSQEEEDLLSVLTTVNRHVAFNKEHNQFKQMPVIQSTLTRKLYLKSAGMNKKNKDIEDSLEIIQHKIDQMTKILETNQSVNNKRPLKKQPAITQWDGLRTGIQISTTSLPEDNTIYRLGNALKIFLEDEVKKHDDDEILKFGETIIHLLAFWEHMDEDQCRFAYMMLTTYLKTYATNWKIYSLLDIPKSVTISDHHHRRSSQSSVSHSCSYTGSLPRQVKSTTKPVAKK